MWTATWKGLVAHKVRLALTALAVVLGVSFLAGTLVLTDTMNHTFDRLFADVSSGVDVSVRAKSLFEGDDSASGDREPLPASLLETVRRVPGVKAAEGNVDGHAQLVDKKGEAIETGGAPTVGVNWNKIPDLGPLRLRSGRAPTAGHDVVVDAVTAKKHRIAVGDRIKILFQGPAEEFEVVGITGFGAADNLAGATLAAFETSTAQRVLGRSGQFDSVELQSADGVSDRTLRQRVARVLPPNAEAVTGKQLAKENASAVKSGMGIFRTALLVFAGISLFVGAFTIYNTFSIIVAQRTREMALLRALGASRGQVTRSVLAEALVVGVLASAVGLGLGLLIAIGLQGLLQGFGIDLPSSSTQFLPSTVVTSMILGVGVTCAASVLPARRAANVPPVAAMRDVAVPATSLRRRLIAGTVVTALGALLLGVGLFSGMDDGAAVVGLGAMATFIGVAVLSPVFAGPLARTIGGPLPRLFGVPGKLARDNATRNPRRTASTAVALMIGLGLVTTVTVLASSVKASMGDQMDRALGVDYLLSAKQFSGFSPEVARQLRAGRGIDVASSVRMGEWRYRDAHKSLSAVEPEAVGALMRVDMKSGRAESLRDGSVLVWDKEARQHGWKVGQVIPMGFSRTGVRDVRIGGTFERNQPWGNYLVSSAFYEANYTSVLDFLVLVKADRGVPPEVSRATVERALAAYPNIDVRDLAEFKREQQGQVDQMLGLMYALLGLAVIIALLGIVNTLALSVFERTRELGLVRAVGMSRRQLKRMVRWESVIIAVLGAVLGLAVGLLFGLALVRALHDDGLSRLVVPGGSLVLFLVLAGLAGVAAAALPARRAARLDVLAAIAHE